MTLLKNLVLSENRLESVEIQIQAEIEKWIVIQKKVAVLKLAIDDLKTESDSIEEILLPIIKQLDEQRIVINTSIVQYKTRKTTGIKYKETFEKALSIVTKDQQAILQKCKDEFTTKGENESIAIDDSELKAFLKQLSSAISGADVLGRIGDIERLPKNIIAKKKREGTLEEAISIPKLSAKSESLLGNILRFLSRGLKTLIGRAQISADNLARVVALTDEEAEENLEVSKLNFEDDDSDYVPGSRLKGRFSSRRHKYDPRFKLESVENDDVLVEGIEATELHDELKKLAEKYWKDKGAKFGKVQTISDFSLDTAGSASFSSRFKEDSKFVTTRAEFEGAIGTYDKKATLRCSLFCKPILKDGSEGGEIRLTWTNLTKRK